MQMHSWVPERRPDLTPQTAGALVAHQVPLGIVHSQRCSVPLCSCLSTCHSLGSTRVFHKIRGTLIQASVPKSDMYSVLTWKEMSSVCQMKVLFVFLLGVIALCGSYDSWAHLRMRGLFCSSPESCVSCVSVVISPPAPARRAHLVCNFQEPTAPSSQHPLHRHHVKPPTSNNITVEFFFLSLGLKNNCDVLIFKRDCRKF